MERVAAAYDLPDRAVFLSLGGFEMITFLTLASYAAIAVFGGLVALGVVLWIADTVRSHGGKA